MGFPGSVIVLTGIYGGAIFYTGWFYGGAITL